MCSMYTRSVLALIVLVMVTGCQKADPVETAKQFYSLAKEGQWEQAMKIIDLDAKASSMFSDIYANGSDEDKKKTQDILGERLKETTERTLRDHFVKSDGAFRVLAQTEKTAEVKQVGDGLDIIYILEYREKSANCSDCWVIVDRTHEKEGIRPNVALGVSGVLKRANQELGRDPTLAELNERLPGLLKSTGVRAIQIGAVKPAAE